MPKGVYPHRRYSVEERLRMSTTARERGYGRWMKGRTASSQTKEKHRLHMLLRWQQLRWQQPGGHLSATARGKPSAENRPRLLTPCRQSLRRATSEPIFLLCGFCGLTFIQPARCGRKAIRKFCSRECAGRNRVGPKSPRWRGGVSSLRHRAMGQLPYKRWRRAVFVRDDFTCQCCGRRGVKLNADHIRPWSVWPSLRYEVSNGQTLCIFCHQEKGRHQCQSVLPVAIAL